MCIRDRSCGIGKRSRSLTVRVVPKFGGLLCPATKEVETCQKRDCPVDCVMGAWSAWNECTNSCNGGTSTRWRSVLRAAESGGKACPATEAMRTCNAHECPIDCAVTAFGDWTECSAV